MIKLISMGFMLLIFSCSRTDVNISPSQFKVIAGSYLLKEYDEDNSKLYSFSYSGDFLETHTIYNSGSQTHFDYRYNEQGRPDTIFVTQPLYNYFIIPEFNDTLVSILNIYIENDLKLKYIIDYDETGKIIRISKVSIRSGLVAQSLFTWEGNNIKQYEVRFELVIPPVDYIYEYQYDDRKNPYKNVFRRIGLNLIDFMPVSENNWLTMVGYNKDYPQTRLTIKNLYAYTGPGYPFAMSKSTVDYDGRKSERLGNYQY